MVVCGGVWVCMLDLGLILTIYPKQRTSQLHAVPRTPCAVLFARVHAHHMPIGARFRWYIMFPPPSSGDLANHDHGAVNENTMVMTMPVRNNTKTTHHPLLGHPPSALFTMGTPSNPLQRPITPPTIGILDTTCLFFVSRSLYAPPSA